MGPIFGINMDHIDYVNVYVVYTIYGISTVVQAQCLGICRITCLIRITLSIYTTESLYTLLVSHLDTPSVPCCAEGMSGHLDYVPYVHAQEIN